MDGVRVRKVQENLNLESSNSEKPKKLATPNPREQFLRSLDKLTRILCLATGSCSLELLSHMEPSQKAGKTP